MGAGMSETHAICPEMDRERLLLITEEYGVTKVQFATIIQCKEVEANEIFDREDKGRVDAYEFLCALFLVCRAPMAQKAEMIFKLYDFDGNLFISRDELVIMLMSALSALAHISNGKLPTLDLCSDLATLIMNSSDVNNDRKISITEFLCFVTKDKNFLKFLSGYGLITKDDLRPNFGWATDDFPDCDSDLENEVLHKCSEKQDEFLPASRPPIGVFLMFCSILKKRTATVTLKSPKEAKGEDKLLIGKFSSDKNALGGIGLPQDLDSESPDANLELEYIHGYRCEDTRNNLRYNKEGDIIYHTASVGIVLNQGLNTQRHFLEHTSEIVCLAMHPNMIYVATGDVGETPKICIWDSTTMECLARISGLLKKGISHLCFSSDGNYLAASGMDDYHCIAIYDWDKCTTTAKNVANKAKKANTSALVAAGQLTPSPILSLLFNPSGDQLIAPAVNELNFISFAGGVIKVQKGECQDLKDQSLRPDKQALLCAAYVGTTLVTGCFNGQLLAWKGKKLSHHVSGHKGCVNAIWPRPNLAGIITGSNDGTIKIWDQSLKEIATIDIANDKRINSIVPRIRSVCESADGNILVGTRSGDIIEITRNTPKVLVRCHSKNELWGLAIHPKKPEYVTLGRDNLLIVWDIVTRKMKSVHKIDCMGNVISFAHDGKIGAMGLTNGQIAIFDGDSYEIIANRKDTMQGIVEVKFSPNGQTLAASSLDLCVYIYDVAKKFRLTKKLKAQLPKMHMDFSTDNEFLQTVSSSMELSCLSLEKGKKVEILDHMKWATYNSPAGKPINGIWEENVSKDIVKAVDRLSDNTILATADTMGLVKLFKFPCPVFSSSYKSYKGHSGAVSNVKFTPDGKYLISIGATDKSIFQWRFVKETFPTIEEDKPKVIANYVIDEPLCSDTRKEDFEFRPQIPVGPPLKLPEEDKKSPVKEKKGGPKSIISESEGGETNKKRRLISDIAHSQPKDFKASHSSVFLNNSLSYWQQIGMPDANISAKFVYGYRSYDTRNNVKWTKHGSVLYHTGALGIVLDPSNNSQTFFVQHERDIVSLAIHPNGMIAATGELVGEADFPEVYVWNIETKDILARLKGFHTKAVKYLKFSPNGSKLLTIGEDIDHSFALYDWMSNQILASAKVDRSEITSCEFKSDSEFVTVGVKSMKSWTINGYNCYCSKGFMKDFEPLTTAAFAFTSKICVTGTTMGNVVEWNGREAVRVVPGHNGPIFSMMSKSNSLITAGQDGNIITWDNTLKQLSVISMSDMLQSPSCVRAVDVNNAGAYLVGTACSEIIKLQQGSAEMLVQGHFKGELWGLAACPNGEDFVTCAGDNLVRVWTVKLYFQREIAEGKSEEVKQQPLKAEKELASEPKSCDWSGNGSFIVVGCVGGKIYSLDPENELNILSEIQSIFEKTKWVSDIKISPNNQLIAVGGAPDPSTVEILKVNEKGNNLLKMKVIDIGLTANLIHLDWDVSSTTLITNSANFELVYVNVPTSSVMKAAACAECDWYTWTSVLGFTVKGISLAFRDYIDIGTVCRSLNRKILATGDDYGKVKLYKYPCIDSNATFKTYIGHSSRVAKVVFLGDKHLISIGIRDKAVIVWNLAIDEEEIRESPTVKQPEEQAAGMEAKPPAIELKQASPDAKKEVFEAPPTEIHDLYSEVDPAELQPPKSDLIPAHERIDAIRDPSGFYKLPANQGDEPKVNMRLKYVYGYKTKNCKNNLCYLKDGCIAFHAATLGIVHDKSLMTQRFFHNHEHEIVAVAFHPDGIRVATGDYCEDPSIYIWDSTTCNQVAHFYGQLKKGVRSLSYSPSGDYLAAVGMGENHIIAIYDASNAILLAMTITDQTVILDLAFRSEHELITVGVKHYMFWQISNKSLTCRKGIFGGHNDILGCVSAEKDLILTGNKAGEVYKWDDVIIEHPQKFHDKPIDCIIIAEQIILTGGRDAKVCILDKKFTLLMEINMADPQYASTNPEIRALSLDKMGKHLLVGTIGSEIYELSIEPSSKKVEKWEPLIKGHSSPRKELTTELRGLCIHGDGRQFSTVSDDATLRIWDFSLRTQVGLINLKEACENALVAPKEQKKSIPGSRDELELKDRDKGAAVFMLKEIMAKKLESIKDGMARAVDIDEAGTKVVVGYRNGCIQLITIDASNDLLNLKGKAAIEAQQSPKVSSFLYGELKDEFTAPISVIRLAPDQHRVAIGSESGMMKIFHFPSLDEIASCRHDAPVTHLDWTADSEVIHTNSADHKLLFWKASNGELLQEGPLIHRDATWNTWTCIYGWPTQGIIYEQPVMVTTCMRSLKTHYNYNLLAVGDAAGMVKLYRYPCLQLNAKCLTGRGHASAISNARFCDEDKYILTTGLNDGCIFQWEITH